MAASGSPTETLRYRSSHGRVPYAQALIALVEHARNSADDFDFGPYGLAELVLHGLTVTGPSLDAIARLLDNVEGLHKTGE